MERLWVGIAIGVGLATTSVACNAVLGVQELFGGNADGGIETDGSARVDGEGGAATSDSGFRSNDAACGAGLQDCNGVCVDLTSKWQLWA